jgi:dsRNA-specific ribonuclease
MTLKNLRTALVTSFVRSIGLKSRDKPPLTSAEPQAERYGSCLVSSVSSVPSKGSMTDISKAELSLDVSFSNKALLQRAFTHRSYLNENPDYPLEDNERLEFLGDAVLDFITGEYLYHRFPEMPEGRLTNLRSALVRTESLADFAANLDLGDYLFLGRGEEDSGGRKRPAILC